MDYLTKFLGSPVIAPKRPETQQPVEPAKVDETRSDERDQEKKVVIPAEIKRQSAESKQLLSSSIKELDQVQSEISKKNTIITPQDIQKAATFAQDFSAKIGNKPLSPQQLQEFTQKIGKLVPQLKTTQSYKKLTLEQQQKAREQIDQERAQLMQQRTLNQQLQKKLSQLEAKVRKAANLAIVDHARDKSFVAEQESRARLKHMSASQATVHICRESLSYLDRQIGMINTEIQSQNATSKDILKLQQILQSNKFRNRKSFNLYAPAKGEENAFAQVRRLVATIKAKETGFVWEEMKKPDPKDPNKQIDFLGWESDGERRSIISGLADTGSFMLHQDKQRVLKIQMLINVQSLVFQIITNVIQKLAHSAERPIANVLR